MKQSNEPREQRLNTSIQEFFGMLRIPFSEGLRNNELFQTPALIQVAKSVEFATQNDFYYAIIGEVGSGKSTALRYACDRMKANGENVFYVVAGSWSFTELLRYILSLFGQETRSFMPALMLKDIQASLKRFSDEGKRVVLAIDEAHLLKRDVFAQLHTLTQYPGHSRQIASIILCGQDQLAERLASDDAMPLASRITDGYFMEPLTKDVYLEYFHHHLNLAKAPAGLFEDMAIDAIWTGSSRNLRTIGITCMRCLQEAVNRNQQSVTAATVREIIGSGWWSNARKVPGKDALK